MRGPMLLLLAPAIVMAQRSAVLPAEAFDRDMKRNRLGTWLVLEDDGAAWGATVRSALEEDALVMLNLPLRVVTGGKKSDALAPILRERYGWAKGAHWALVDAKGRVLEEGKAAPTVPALVSAAEQAGIRSRAQELEAFLRQNPDHLEAQVTLLRERAIVASRRTRKALPPTPEPAPGTSAPGADTIPKLDPESDLKIWAPVVQQLEGLFQGGWREVAIDLGLALRISNAENSPAMAAVLTRHRADIEDALRRRPGGFEPWMLWLQASRKCGGWPLAPLLQTLQPLPGVSAMEWPPSMVVTEFVRDARARRDWNAIREVLVPRWEEIRTADYRWSGQVAWDNLLSPLLEAQISLGDVGSADQLVGEVTAVEGWQGLAGSARELAIRLNRPDLAARWGGPAVKAR